MSVERDLRRPPRKSLADEIAAIDARTNRLAFFGLPGLALIGVGAHALLHPGGAFAPFQQEARAAWATLLLGLLWEGVNLWLVVPLTLRRQRLARVREERDEQG